MRESWRRCEVHRCRITSPALTPARSSNSPRRPDGSIASKAPKTSPARPPTGLSIPFRRLGGQWTVLLDNIEGTGTPLQIRDPNATTLKKYFYRIILLP